MNRRIKIAHVAHSVGGVDVYIRLILKNIDPEKFETIVMHGANDTQNAFYDAQDQKIQNFTTSIIRNISPIKDLSAIIDTYRVLKREKPDVIHSHSAKGGIIGKVVGGLLGIRVFYTPHAFSFLSSSNKIKRQVFLIIEKFFVTKNCLLVATSNSEKEQALKTVGYQPENVFVFDNCINPINNIAELKIEKTWPDNYICTVGRPSYQKNIELMIEVLSEIHKTLDIHLVIMGVGHHSDQLESVKRKIDQLQLSDKVTLLDWTSQSDVFNIISKSKLYLSTSRYEGLPYSIIESLALSKATVVTNCDGNRDLIKDGYNGYVIDGNKPKQFAKKVIKLLSDEELLARFSANAYNEFIENYDIRKNIRKLEALYSKYSKKA